MKSENWIGHQQGQLTIVEFLGLRSFGRGKAAYFKFRCTCGNEFESQKSNVIGKRLDCGCTSGRKLLSAPPGSSSDLLHKRWAGMISRCENPNMGSFKDYGGRGISVCERWKIGDGRKTGFELFVEDMGRPDPGQTIERINGDGDYEPGNCKWITKGEQSRNRRNVMLLEINGRTQTIPEWCAENGVKYFTAKMRIRRGWSAEKAVTFTNN